MSKVAEKALARLLGLAENAACRVGDDADATRVVSLRFSEASFADYLQLPTHAAKAECNGLLQLAERAGAILIDWDTRAAAGSRVERIAVADKSKLAEIVGVTPRWEQVAQAELAFQVHQLRHPALLEVLGAWRRGVQARGTKAGDIADWLDAVAVVDACRARVGQDVPVRRLSASMFADSKRIEGLSPVVDALVTGTLGGLSRDAEEVFAEIGLVKFPPTFLLAGDLTFEVGAQHVQSVRPYIGLSPHAISSIRCAPGTWSVLTVENLTTFHELVARASECPGLVVVYTGGMPSPSWKRAFAILVAALPAGSKCSHWGDIDAGGFRIASHVASVCDQAGVKLDLHSMAIRLPDSGVVRRVLSNAEVTEIERICLRWSWQAEAAAAAMVRAGVEQESMPVSWPKRS
jgi:hypothetical protein